MKPLEDKHLREEGEKAHLTGAACGGCRSGYPKWPTSATRYAAS